MDVAVGLGRCCVCFYSKLAPVRAGTELSSCFFFLLCSFYFTSELRRSLSQQIKPRKPEKILCPGYSM